MRAPGSLFNTHIRSTKGLITKGDLTNMRKVNVDLRFTSDERGETLSLTVDNIQIAVRFDQVEKLVEETRKDRAKA